MFTFSFIIPVYNCKNYLIDCVHSIIDAIKLQGSLCEIILVNDGSTDGSHRLCISLKNSYPKIIKLFSQHNKGVSAARNLGLNKAEGQYVIFIDADDSIESEKMATLMNKIQNDSSIDMAVFGINYNTYKKNKLISIMHLSPALSGRYNKKEWLDNLLSLYETNALTSIWSRIIKKDVLVDNNITFNENLFSFEDLDFCLRAMAFCNEILFVPDLIYNYEVRNTDDKYQKRVDRIEYIGDVVDCVEDSIHCLKDDEETDSILIDLYSILLNSKQNNKTKEETLALYDEFIAWVNKHEYCQQILNNKGLKEIYYKKYNSIKIKKIYYSFRHIIASFIKQKIHYVGNKL